MPLLQAVVVIAVRWWLRHSFGIPSRSPGDQVSMARHLVTVEGSHD